MAATSPSGSSQNTSISGSSSNISTSNNTSIPSNTTVASSNTTTVVTSTNITCNDGNKVSGDGCDQTGHVEVGFNCTTNRQTSLDLCYPICGDGIDTDMEQCDMGTLNGKGLGCTAACSL